MKTEKLKWVGPSGHTSPLCGDLVPGRLYDVPSEHVGYFLTLRDFWERPAMPSKASPKKEKE